MKPTFVILIVLFPLFTKCKKETEYKHLEIEKSIITEETINIDTSKIVVNQVKLYSKSELSLFKDSSFVVLKKIDTTFQYDMKYATTDNFLKEKVYDCDDCLVRYKTAKQLIKINDSFKIMGYKIKFFDCYRPLSIQKKMWKIYPDKRYVANPENGSNHNRGSAVDITLVDNLGMELDMGTEFDFFGRKAHHAYQNLPQEVLENRKLLKSVMEANEFWSITSEWWHYNLVKSFQYKVSDFKTECEN
jgi:D-alanyl-D-alanine dipeptidase